MDLSEIEIKGFNPTHTLLTIFDFFLVKPFRRNNKLKNILINLSINLQIFINEIFVRKIGNVLNYDT